MASLNMFFTPTVMTIRPKSRSVLCKATAAKGSGGSEEKSLLDWILGGMQKEDQLLETDPILNKVDDPADSRKGSSTISVQAPPKKKSGGFGGLFAK